MGNLLGSICLSDIPKEQMKKVQCKDGSTRIYLNISVVERKTPSKFGHTHFISCAPKKDERKDGVNYIIGDLKEYKPVSSTPTTEDIDKAPSVGSDDDLPF